MLFENTISLCCAAIEMSDLSVESNSNMNVNKKVIQLLIIITKSNLIRSYFRVLFLINITLYYLKLINIITVII